MPWISPGEDEDARWDPGGEEDSTEPAREKGGEVGGGEGGGPTRVQPVRTADAEREGLTLEESLKATGEGKIEKGEAEDRDRKSAIK